jgi:hypothetical protein
VCVPELIDLCLDVVPLRYRLLDCGSSITLLSPTNDVLLHLVHPPVFFLHLIANLTLTGLIGSVIYLCERPELVTTT